MLRIAITVRCHYLKLGFLSRRVYALAFRQGHAIKVVHFFLWFLAQSLVLTFLEFLSLAQHCPCILLLLPSSAWKLRFLYPALWISPLILLRCCQAIRLSMRWNPLGSLLRLSRMNPSAHQPLLAPSRLTGFHTAWTRRLLMGSTVLLCWA